MTVPPSPTPPRGPQAARPARQRTLRLAGWFTLALVALLILALSIAYLARRSLAREALLSWLESNGVEAEAHIETLGPGGIVGDLRIGPADAPLVTAERAEVDYRLTWPWTGEGFGLEVSRIRLISPTIRASLTADGVSLGPLDDLIADFRARPARPGAEPPEIIVEDGLLRLSHKAGQAVVHLDARMDEGVLTRLSARMEETRLTTGAFDLRLDEARVGLVTRDGRASAHLVASLEGAEIGDVELGAGSLSLAVAAPYPDLAARASEGPVVLALQLETEKVSGPETTARDVRLQGGFEGAAAGNLSNLRLKGEGGVVLTSAAATLNGISTGPLAASLSTEDLDWSRAGEGHLRMDVETSLKAEGLAAGDLALRRVALRMNGQARIAGSSAEISLQGPLSGAGAWRGLGEASADDLATVAAVKRAASDFAFSAPDLGVDYRGGSLAVDVGSGGATVRSASGGTLRIDGRSGTPLYRAGRGALELSMSGGGLPEADLTVSRYKLDGGALNAAARVSLATDLGPLEQLNVDAAGRLRFSQGKLAFTAESCAPITAARFEAGTNSVENITAELCPTGGPNLLVQGGAWRIDGRVDDGGAEVPFLQARLAEADGQLAFGGDAAGLAAEVRLTSARLIDMTEPERFLPVAVTGQARLAHDVWTADLDLAQASSKLADVTLRHDGRQAAGGVTIDTGRLRFAEGGLQPADISPLAAAIGSPAVGEARFQGRFDWSNAGTESRGELEIFDLAFKSPVGDVETLQGKLAFDSLLPLTTAPGQKLQAGAIRSMAPLSDAQLVFQLEETGIVLSSGELTLGEGHVRIEPTTIPLDRTQSWRGTLIFESVELSDIVEASPFGDRVDLSARVSGRLPFIAGPDGVSFVQGRLAADGPGRLSIRRAALTQVDATGGGASAQAEALGDQAVPLAEAEDTNAAVEFAYQAMEHLAFDLLDAEVNSLPGGRLGVLFRIRGQHAPPEKQEIRLTLGELIRRDFLDRELPLPSGTEVDLTLDTSLNLDQLLSDYARARSIDGSAPVQTPAPQ